ncbi:MAG: SAM-dependent DNA methyltransferase [Chitinophagaceae bacterium]|nr:MAG: SAM-dependent DNA methyltransferase [Chitinophagaceae bacterium]
MITGELKSKIDRIWDAFWSGGISNPLTVVEQITYLLFIKRLDELQTQAELKANLNKKSIENPIFSAEQENLRWSRFKDIDSENMYKLVSLEVFPFMKELGTDKSEAWSKYMRGATFMIPTPNLLEKVVSMISDIPMQDRDTKGDVYEYLLAHIATAGKNGQFRTPRHIIKLMVDIMQPTPEDVICDPSMGSAGFLVAAGEYLREHHKEIMLDSNLKKHFNNRAFNGIEFDATMIRIGAMNLLLHGIENANLIDKDALSESNAAERNKYTLILANPPFKGSLDRDSVAKDLLGTVDTKKTELLFLGLMLKMLEVGGRCAVIVPDGVLFGSSNAHKAIREQIIDKQKLEAVISMPSGVFKPYAGVSTAILVFTKTNSGGTDHVWFYDMLADGFSLDDKRNPLDAAKHETNNLPDILQRYRNRKDELKRARTDQSFMVPLAEIQGNNYDLSINRYKDMQHTEIKYLKPSEILKAIYDIDKKRFSLLKELEEIL